MAINISDFDKIWASTSPLTPYAFSDTNYQQGWNFVGATPPARQMWDFLQKQNDEKSQWLYNNKLSLSGGTMTGELILSDGGMALSDATVGTLITDTANSVSLPQSTATTLASITLPVGVWIITGHMYINGSNVTADKFYALGIGATANNVAYGEDGTIATQSSYNGNIVLQTTRIYDVSQQMTLYMCALATAATTVSSVAIRAIRIK